MNEVKAPFYVEDIFVGKTFNDFSINPQKGVVKRRGEVVLSSLFSRNIPLNLPVASANMDTVTGQKMCIAMAQAGGIGILPRSDSISIEQQIEWVREVKRAENFIIENPYKILETSTIREARGEMKLRKVGTLLVINKRSRLTGMLEDRKIRLCGESELAKDWMIKGEELKFSKKNISTLAEAKDELNCQKADKLILVGKDSKIRGLITSRDIAELDKKPLANKDAKGRLRVGAAIGATGDYLERASSLIDFDVDVIVMDIAHGHHIVMEEAVSNFRRKFSHELVCGNVATYEGAQFLRDLGVDGIKVGLGPGHGCWTRIETGVGVPQIHAIRAVRHALRGCDIPFIADGGVEFPGDVCKALAAGASSVMMGSFFAGTEETPGETIYPGGSRPYKFYRGMTSSEAKLESLQSADDIQNVEGGTKQVPFVGSVKKILNRIKPDLQSMVSYAGEKSLQDAIGKISQDPIGYLIPLSPASQEESYKREDN